MDDHLLAGLRVIDAASFIAGPVAATILADLGADVIKIEPPAGDPYRHRTGGAGVPESPYNYRWIVDNRRKRGLALDLRHAAGRDVLYRLVARADVFVTNTPLESRRRLGIRWEDLASLNPRLIYASLTAYGERGEEAPRTGFDATALWARTGLMDLVAALSGARVEARPPREEAASALANLYRCADGRWFLLNVLNDDRDWPALLRAIGRPDLDGDPRFAATPARRAHARALVGVLDTVFAARPWAEWRRLLHAHGLTFGAVATLDDAREDQQMVESGALVPIDDPRAGAPLTVASPLWLEGVEKVAPRYDADEIERLLASGVVVQAGRPS